MSRALAESYQKSLNKIRDLKKCWVRGLNGKWHQTTDEKTVAQRIGELESEIAYHYPLESNSIFNWD